jgi:putative transcriptional regulator
MPRLSEAELLARDANRDLEGELLESIRELRAGNVGRVSVVTRDGRASESPVARARVMSQLSQLSQAQFASLLGVSTRTLKEWEQGRREPSGAAKTLLRVVERHPEVLRDPVS